MASKGTFNTRQKDKDSEVDEDAETFDDKNSVSDFEERESSVPPDKPRYNLRPRDEDVEKQRIAEFLKSKRNEGNALNRRLDRDYTPIPEEDLPSNQHRRQGIEETHDVPPDYEDEQLDIPPPNIESIPDEDEQLDIPPPNIESIPDSKTIQYISISTILSKMVVFAIFGIVLAYLSYLGISASKVSDPNKSPEVLNMRLGIEKYMQKLSKSYKSQDGDTWVSIFTAVTERYPVVLTFLYDDSLGETECLIDHFKKIIEKAAKPKRKPIELKGSKINFYEPLAFIDEYKNQLKESYLMIVCDVDHLSGNIAESFHSYCDEENPIVENAILIFTIKIDHSVVNNKDRPSKKASKILDNTWDALEISRRDPLVTRMTSTVLEIKKENNFVCPNIL